MKHADYSTMITVDQAPAEVFVAINNVCGWWSKDIEGNTDQLNEVWNYHYQDVHRCKIKVTALVPNKKVVWEVVDNYFSFTTDKNEWKGNQIVFEITEKAGRTQLQFTQIGLVPEYECYDICENAWNTYIHKSLYALINTGTGQPNGTDNPQTDDEKKLGASGFTTTFFVNQTPAEVFAAVNNVSGWWQGSIDGETNKPDGVFTYKMKDVHFSKQQIVEWVPDQKITWLVTDSNLNFTKDPGEWTGTKIIFEMAQINNKTQLRFTHEGLVPRIECYEGCSQAWERLIQESLFALITTGTGTNIFD